MSLRERRGFGEPHAPLRGRGFGEPLEVVVVVVVVVDCMMEFEGPRLSHTEAGWIVLYNTKSNKHASKI